MVRPGNEHFSLVSISAVQSQRIRLLLIVPCITSEAWISISIDHQVIVKPIIYYFLRIDTCFRKLFADIISSFVFSLSELFLFAIRANIRFLWLIRSKRSNVLCLAYLRVLRPRSMPWTQQCVGSKAFHLLIFRSFLSFLRPVLVGDRFARPLLVPIDLIPRSYTATKVNRAF